MTYFSCWCLVRSHLEITCWTVVACRGPPTRMAFVKYPTRGSEGRGTMGTSGNAENATLHAYRDGLNSLWALTIASTQQLQHETGCSLLLGALYSRQSAILSQISPAHWRAAVSSSAPRNSRNNPSFPQIHTRHAPRCNVPADVQRIKGQKPGS